MTQTFPLAFFAALWAALAVWWALPGDPLRRLRASASRPRWSGLRRWASRLPMLPTKRDVRRQEALRRSVPATCSLLASCLAAGAPPRRALRDVARVVGAPAGPELTTVVQRIDVGVDEADAWADLGSVAGYEEMSRDVARAIRSGLGLADLLHHHAGEARLAVASAAMVRARGAGVRGVLPLMICFLPAFFALGIIPLFATFRFNLPLP